MKHRPFIAPDQYDFTIDVLSTPAFVTVKGKDLKTGMVVMDAELKTPEILLSLPRPSTPRSGNVEFLARDLNDDHWFQFIAFSNSRVAVLAAIS